MADYSSWQERPVSTTSLQLDPDNPRIPPGPAPLVQRELIGELVEHDKVYDLAKEITDNGYSPLESLIGLVNEEDGKTYILEGNRRLAALKLLISPELAPEAAAKRFRTLSTRVPVDSIKKVRVLFAPSREQAAPLIMQKHTRNQVEGWSTLQQARFYKSLAREGLSIEELARKYGGTPGEIARFLRMESLYEAACTLEFPADVAKRVHDPREFPATVLQRLMDIQKARDFLGIEFDENGSFRGKIHPDEFRKGFARILTDIAKGLIDTRKLNKVEDAEKYLAGLGEDTPNTGRRGRFGPEDLAQKKGGAVQAPAATPAKTAKAKATRVSSALIPRGAKFGLANHRIREVFNELRILKVERFPNTCGVMLRVLLELAVSYYLDKTGKIDLLLERARKDGKGKDWYPTLRQMLNAMLQDDEVSASLSTLARKRLQKLVSDKESLLSVENLDAFTHNRFALPNSRELRGLWDTLEGTFELVLQEPPKPPKAKPEQA